jgi:hypothetical protein
LKQLPAFRRQRKLRDVSAKRNSRREPAVTVLRRSAGSDLKAVSSNTRGFTIAVFSLPLLLVMTASVRAQAPAAPRPAPHEAARPANGQDMFGWLRQFAPTQRRQSRAVSSPPLPRPRPAEFTPIPIGPSRRRVCASFPLSQVVRQRKFTARRTERGSAERLKDPPVLQGARRDSASPLKLRYVAGGQHRSVIG